MRNNLTKDMIPESNEGLTLPDGLTLSGKVIDRTRRMVPKEAPTTLIVTYTIEDEMGNKYYVDEFAPNEYFELGMDISVPVYIKAYKKKSKEAAYTKNIKKDVIFERGEHF